MKAGKRPWENKGPRTKNFGPPLEYLRALRSEIVRDWRFTKRPKKRDIKKWARQVWDLNICIAAMEAEIVEQHKPIKR